MTRKYASLILLGIFFCSDGHADENQASAPSGAFATMTLESKMYLLDPLPDTAGGAVSGWYYTLIAPDFYLTEDTLEENLRSNAQKFCAGGEWKPLHKNLQAHRIEFSFACYDQKAIYFKEAAIAQGMPIRSAR